jgi:hypothetical protein
LRRLAFVHPVVPSPALYRQPEFHQSLRITAVFAVSRLIEAGFASSANMRPKPVALFAEEVWGKLRGMKLEVAAKVATLSATNCRRFKWPSLPSIRRISISPNVRGTIRWYVSLKD